MAEDDEIDVLGDFSLDNILSKSETGMFDNGTLVSQNSDLLNCDYTIHPQWLLDKPSTNPALWYNSSTDPDLDSDLARQFELESQANEPHISTENSITDESGWTEKEKTLLNRGIEIFGKNNFNLSQFIGSRTPAEVKYFFKNFHSEVEITYSTVNENVLFDNCIQETVITSNNMEDAGHNYMLNEDEIPASIEEIIAAVSTATPTVPNIKRKKPSKPNCSKSEYLLNYEDIPSGQSLLKSNYIKEPAALIRQHKLKENKKRNLGENSRQKKLSEKSNKSAKFKFKTKLFMNYEKVLNQTNGNKEIMQPNNRRRKQINNLGRKSSVSVSLSESDSVQSETSDVQQIVTGNGLGVPLCQGEEVIKIRKENEATDTDSDIEIDIEDTDDEILPLHPTLPNIATNTAITDITTTNEICEPITKIEENQQTITNQTGTESSNSSKSLKQSQLLQRKCPELADLSKEVIDELMSLEHPTCEIALPLDEISEVEKYIFHEFFEGGLTKTPARYLKIRNHILITWKSIKPSYVTKTSIRQGLKQAGDVNCIGRIHNYLEQIGAVNFGCSLTSYLRPLYDLANVVLTPRERPTLLPELVMPRTKFETHSRPRNKKKYIHDGEGGCTLTHDERGEIINTTVINDEPVLKPRQYIKKATIRLIYCRAFTEGKQQEYVVRLDLSALILMDLHAHMYMTEVMGLMGGHWDDIGRVLSVNRYEPCMNIASSSTHCDMCPISQARAAEIFHCESLDILGWYHSHPTFAPEPSQQDLDTQLHVQQWIGHNRPCIGVILSPFSLNGALIASPYRCLIVDKKENFEDQYVPYKFKVDLIAEHVDVSMLLKQASRIVANEVALKDLSAGSKIEFMKPYFQDHSITHLDKYIYSIKMHLAKCSGINKMTCDAIIQGLSEMCATIVR